MVLRIFKMIATSSFLTALECTKFVFGRGSVPDPTGRAYSAPPDPLAGLRALILKGRGRGEVRTFKEGKTPPPPLSTIPGSAAALYMEARRRNVLFTNTARETINYVHNDDMQH